MTVTATKTAWLGSSNPREGTIEMNGVGAETQPITVFPGLEMVAVKFRAAVRSTSKSALDVGV